MEGTYPSDITLVNWPHNDYMLGNLMRGSSFRCETPSPAGDAAEPFAVLLDADRGAAS